VGFRSLRNLQWDKEVTGENVIVKVTERQVSEQQDIISLFVEHYPFINDSKHAPRSSIMAINGRNSFPFLLANLSASSIKITKLGVHQALGNREDHGRGDTEH